MQVLAEESWAWMLFEHQDTLLLSVVCGSIGLYTVEFSLSHDERVLYEQQGDVFIKQLARQVSREPESFRERRLKNFENMAGVKEAAATWRATHVNAP